MKAQRIRWKRSFALLLWVVASHQANAQTSGSPQRDAIDAALKQIDRDIDGFKKRQFIAYDPNYQQEQASRVARLRVLGRQVFSREASGKDVQVAHSILIEVRWLITATADFKQVDRRLG